MKRKFLALLLIGVFLTAAPAHALLFWNFSKKEQPQKPVIAAPAPDSLTLLESYHLALKKSETVALSAEEINQAQARFYRSFNYFLPTVHFLMSDTYRDVNGDSGSSSGISSDSGRRSTPENKFTFTQPLFSGFKEIAAIQGSGADKKQQFLNWKRAKELLFVDVMNAYYAVLQAQKNVHTLARTHRLGTHRLRELDKKIRVGRLRAADKQTSLADLKLAESDLVQALSILAVSRNLLEFYIGQPLVGRVLTDEEIPGEIMRTSETAAQAKSRSDVAAREQGYIVAEKKVTAAQADLFPTVSASGNYYTRRVGFQSGDNWDVTVQMDVPIFEMGKTFGDIKEAVSTRESQRLLWQQSRRMAELDIQNALQDLQFQHQREKALWKARKAYEKNYEFVSADYNRSLVNNLDVLDALRRLQEVELRYNEAYFLMKESYWKFKAAVGEVLNGVEQ